MAQTLTLNYTILGGARIAIPGLSGSEGVFETAANTSDPNPIVRTISQQLKAAPTTTAGTVTISAA